MDIRFLLVVLLLAGKVHFNVDGDELYAGEDIGNSLLFDISLSTSSDMIMLLDGDVMRLIWFHMIMI